MKALCGNLYFLQWRIKTSRKHHWKSMLFQLYFSPVLFLVLIFACTFFIKLDNDRNYNNGSTARSRSDVISTLRKTKYVAYAPSNNHTDDLISRMLSKLNWKDTILLKCHNEEELVGGFSQHVSSSLMHVRFVGFVFQDQFRDERSKSTTFTYKIRMSLPVKYCCWENFSLHPESEISELDKGYDAYYESGFLAFQWLLDESYIEKMLGWKSLPVQIMLKELPYIDRPEDKYSDCLLNVILPLFLMLSFLTLIPVIVARFMESEATGFLALSKVHGMKGWLLWLERVLDSLLINILPVTLTTLLLCLWGAFGTKCIINYSDVSMIWAFLFAYMISGTMLCCFICTLFHRRYTAVMCGVILSLATYFAPMTQFFGFCFPNCALRWGIHNIALNDFSAGIENVDLILVFKMYGVSIAVYSVLSLCIYVMSPYALYGIHQCYLYYWMSVLRCKEKRTEKLGRQERFNLFMTMRDSDVLIFVEGIRKEYRPPIFSRRTERKRVVALDNVTFQVHRNKTTAILGSVGAGKTSLVSILIGLHLPSNGTVFINRNRKLTRNVGTLLNSMVGFCPQESSFEPTLSVEEHFMLNIQLRGHCLIKSRPICELWLDKLNLLPYRFSRPFDLPYGLQKLCSIGLAFMLQPSFIVLDSPTSPKLATSERHKIWELIRDMNAQCTLIFTTELADEAFMLADNVVLLCHGHLHISGSVVVVDDYFRSHCWELFFEKRSTGDVRRLTERLLQVIPEAVLQSESLFEVVYFVPVLPKSDWYQVRSHLQKHATNLGLLKMVVKSTLIQGEVPTVKSSSSSVHIFPSPISVGSSGSNSPPFHEKTSRYQVVFDTTFLSRTVSFVGVREGEIYEHELDSKLTRLEEILQSGDHLSEIDVDEPFIACVIRKYIYTKDHMCIVLLLTLLQVVLVLYIQLENSKMTYLYPEASPRMLSVRTYRDPLVISFLKKNRLAQLSDYYTSLVSESSEIYNVFSNGSTIEDILDNTNFSSALGDRFIVGAEFDSSNGLFGVEKTNSLHSIPIITALYSHISEHAAPLSLNLVSNTLLRFFNGTDSVRISAINHPFHDALQMKYLIRNSVCNCSGLYLWMLLLPLGPLLIVSSFVIYPTLIRTKMIVSHRNACVNFSPFAFWISTLVVDFLLYLVVVLVVTILVVVLDNGELLATFAEVYVFFLILYLYGICGILFTYCVSCLYDPLHFEDSFSYLLLINILVGTVMKLLMSILEQGKVSFMRWINVLLNMCPYYLLTHNLENFFIVAVENMRFRHNFTNEGDGCFRDVHDSVYRWDERFTDASCESRPSSCMSSVAYLDWVDTEYPHGMLDDVIHAIFNVVFYGIMLVIVPLFLKRNLRRRFYR